MTRENDLPENFTEFKTDFHVAPQLKISDLESAAKLGIKSIIAARPDGEDENQPEFLDLQAKANELGIEMKCVPVVPGQLSFEQVLEFSEYLRELPGPQLGYCKTGTRAAILWSIDQVSKGEDIEDVLELANSKGYDLSKYEILIESMGLKLENEIS